MLQNFLDVGECGGHSPLNDESSWASKAIGSLWVSIVGPENKSRSGVGRATAKCCPMFTTFSENIPYAMSGTFISPCGSAFTSQCMALIKRSPLQCPGHCDRQYSVTGYVRLYSVTGYVRQTQSRHNPNPPDIIQDPLCNVLDVLDPPVAWP